MKSKKITSDSWRVNTCGLLKEIAGNTREGAALTQPLNILRVLLAQVAKRAIELNDPELNKLMLRLSLYSISDPQSPDFDLKKTIEYIDSH